MSLFNNIIILPLVVAILLVLANKLIYFTDPENKKSFTRDGISVAVIFIVLIGTLVFYTRGQMAAAAAAVVGSIDTGALTF